MRTGLLKTVMVLSMIFVLTGCGDASSQVQNNIETLEESSIQQELQLLIDYEKQLQQDFENSLNQEDLSNFSDTTAAVFSNIDSRSSTVDSMTEEIATYEDVYEELQDISLSEDEEDIADIVGSMRNSLESINNVMREFLPQYGEVLNHEREYFNSLGESSADYDAFSSGLDEVNEQHEEIKGFYHTLNEEITNLNTNKNQALEIINEEGES